MSSNEVPAERRVGAGRGFEPAIIAVMIPGVCTFLNVYSTQPLLPFFQHLFHATEIEVSMTVGAVTLAVAIMAPITGMIAETIGRKRVIVPALFALAGPTALVATAQSLHALIWWRFAQGLFVPGVIAVMMAYINEEFPGRVGAVMAWYVAGTVFGGFLGRFLTGMIAAHGNWRAAFVTLATLDLLGALVVRKWLPLAASFVPGRHVFKTVGDTWGHLRNPRLLAICGMGFTVLFSLVGVFTYANFYLARAPFDLTPAELGSIFFVYLLGCVVTPLAGRYLDRHGFGRTTVVSLGMCLAGLALTLLARLPCVICGLAIFSSGIFVYQSAATVLIGEVAEIALSSAAGLYVTFYYIGGSSGAAVTGWFWVKEGWPGCVGLFGVVSLGTWALGWAGGRPVDEGGLGRETGVETAI